MKRLLLLLLIIMINKQYAMEIDGLDDNVIEQWVKRSTACIEDIIKKDQSAITSQEWFELIKQLGAIEFVADVENVDPHVRHGIELTLHNMEDRFQNYIDYLKNKKKNEHSKA